MSTVTCHTEGCGNAEQPIEIELTYRDDNDVVVQIAHVQCGVCGNPITDIQR